METESVIDYRDTAPLSRATQDFTDAEEDVCQEGMEQMLQAVLLHCGVLENTGWESLRGTAVVADGFERSVSLRTMRQTGSLGVLAFDAQELLLGGTLHQYNADALALPPVASRRAALNATMGASQSLSSMPANSIPSVASSDALERGADDEEAAGDFSGLRRSVLRLISSLEEAEAIEAASQGSSGITPRTIATDARHLPTQTINLLESELDISGIDAAPVRDDAIDEETLLASSLSTQSEDGAAIHFTTLPAVRLEEANHSQMGGVFGDTTRSLAQMEETLLGATFAPEGGIDGGLIGVLRRLAFGGSLDDVLARTVHRALQMGTVASGQRLSDTEIQGLPKVRFEAKEEQSCAICLEAYQVGELLTSLPCSHFFHVDCLARWLRRSQQCPLCRGLPIDD